MKERDKLTSFVVNLGLGSNVILAALKTFVGIFGHSPGLVADGINSTSDVMYYVVVKFFIHQAKKPADVEHPYGHRQLEPIAAIVVGAFILATGLAIFWDSVQKVYALFFSSEITQIASLWALLAAIFTFLLKIGLYYFTRKSAKDTKNLTLKALASDHLNDIMASFAVIIGILAGRIFGWFWTDPMAGAIVAIYIVKTGIEIIVESSREIMDRVPDEKFGRELRDIAMSVDGVRSVEEIGVHKVGQHYTLNITISVSGDISIDEGHDISHKVEQRLLESFDDGINRVHIHYHPHRVRNINKGNDL